MEIIFSEALRVIGLYRNGSISYHQLVHMVDVLRDYSNILKDKLEDLYTTLEIINADQIEKNRPLRENEKAEIATILDEIEAAIIERERANAATGACADRP